MEVMGRREREEKNCGGLEERHDGKAQEAPKSKLQTRRGLGTCAMLVLPPVRRYRVLWEWQASGTGYPAASPPWLIQTLIAER
jgi:hypothetical protein